MNFPQFLNPLRGTRFAWLVPFTWAVVKCAAMAAPTTVEVFLHHRFGARTGKGLLKGFLLLVVSAVSKLGDPPSKVSLFPGFLFAYILAAILHWLTSQRMRPGEHVYS